VKVFGKIFATFHKFFLQKFFILTAAPDPGANVMCIQIRPWWMLPKNNLKTFRFWWWTSRTQKYFQNMGENEKFHKT
jgi:hypothetical protein